MVVKRKEDEARKKAEQDVAAKLKKKEGAAGVAAAAVMAVDASQVLAVSCVFLCMIIQDRVCSSLYFDLL